MRKKVVSALSVTVLSSGLFFLFNFFLAKYLGATVYGEIVYLLSFISLISLFVTMNYVALYMGNRIVQKDKDTFSLFFSVHTLLFIIVSVPAFFILKYFIVSLEQIILILILSYLVVLIQTIGLEYNTTKEVTKSILVSVLIPRLLLIIFFISMLLFGMYSSVDYLYAYLLSSALVIIVMYLKLKPKWYIKKDFFSRAWKFYLLGILGTSFIYIAQILQKKYAGYESLASLSITLLIFAGLSLFGTVLVKFILPKIHELYREKDIARIGVLYQNNTFLELLIVSPMLVILFFQIDKISFLLGAAYKDIGFYFYILSIGYGLGLFTGISGNLLRATEHEKLEIYNEIIRMIIGLGLILSLNKYDFGIVIAMSASMFVYNMLKCAELFFLYGFTSISLKKFIYILVYIGIMIMVNSMISMIENTGLKVGVYVLFLVGIYSAILVYLKKEQILMEGYA